MYLYDMFRQVITYDLVHIYIFQRQIQVFLMDGTSMMLNLSHGDHTTVQHLNLQLLRVGP